MTASVGDHARLAPGSIINGRYAVLHELGCGNFAKVYCCRDDKRMHPNDPELVAVKVLKREYANDARFEADILKAITAKNTDSRYSVLTVVDHFSWGRYPIFVFPLKGQTLRQRKLGVARGGYVVDDVRRFAYDMLRALSFLHFDVRLIHTDLKPENILIDPTSDSTALTGIGSKWTIADFGSASFYKPERLDADLISTRPYRAPEVVLGGSWFYPADTWSMACIIFEVYTGVRLFDVHDDTTHLWMMEGRLGSLPESLTTGLRHSRRLFQQGKLQGRIPTTPVKSMADMLQGEPLLLDLLMRMLVYDPASRLRTDKALSHPYFEAIGRRTSSRESLADAPLLRVVDAGPPRKLFVAPSEHSPIAAAVAVSATESTAAAAAAAASVTVAPQHRSLPASRGESPVLPSVSTNSYEALKYAKYRRGILSRPVLPPAGSGGSGLNLAQGNAVYY